MNLIWAKREGKYFCAKDWTGSISLIGLEKFAVWRKRCATLISLAILSLRRHSGMVRKHQTSDARLRIGESRAMLRISLAMSALESRTDMPFRVSDFRSLTHSGNRITSQPSMTCKVARGELNLDANLETWFVFEVLACARPQSCSH
jgi:hypothetical protein